MHRGAYLKATRRRLLYLRIEVSRNRLHRLRAVLPLHQLLEVGWLTAILTTLHRYVTSSITQYQCSQGCVIALALQTFHSAIEEHTMSPLQPSSEAAATGFSDRAALTSTPPLIDHPLPDEPTSPPWKFNPSPRNPFVTFDLSTPVARTMSLPSRNLLSPNTTPMPTPALPDPVMPTVASPATPRSPSLHPRLASLPPPMMHRYATQGSVRMTPSMGFRPTPMPIMNLPTLPLPTPRTPPLEAVTQSPARLRTMPALPLRGPSEVEEADHENAGLDEMEDVDEMDEEEGDGDDDMEMEMPEEHANDDDESPQEVEVPTMGHRLRSPLPPSLSRSPGLQQLPQVDTSPLNITWRRSPDAVVERPNTQYFTPSDPIPPVDILTTPMPAFRKGAAPPGTDYFTSKSPEAHVATPDVTRTPRPGDIDFVPRTVPMPSATPRPGLYQQGSKSMINLLSMSRKQEQNDEEVSATENRISRAPDYFIATTRDTPQPVAGPSGAVDAATQMTKSPTLRRQRSLPMYTTATEPPPYPAFPPHAGPVVIEPRDEEGREQLPPYTNSIYLVAVMPRKMEFTAPGFQSKDRKWKRALCVLEGTAFRVYRVHSGVVEDWWERTVGVGDRTRIDPFTVGTAGTIRVSGLRATERAREQREPPPRHKEDSSPSQDDIDASEATASTSAPIPPCQTKPPASRSRLHLAASLLHPSRSSKPGESSGGMRSRLSFDVPRDAPRSSTASTPRRSSIDSSCTPSASTSPSTSPSSRIHRNNSSDTSPSSSSIQPSGSAAASRPASVTPATSHFGSTTSSCSLEQVPDPKDLLRSYSLQHAESGLASDYTKRKNVIRVRMEGEQFLLQAKDVPGVIEWIEVSSTNLLEKLFAENLSIVQGHTSCY